MYSCRVKKKTHSNVNLVSLIMDREETPKQSGCEELTDEEKTLTLVVTPRYYPQCCFFFSCCSSTAFLFSREKFLFIL